MVPGGREHAREELVALRCMQLREHPRGPTRRPLEFLTGREARLGAQVLDLEFEVPRFRIDDVDTAKRGERTHLQSRRLRLMRVVSEDEVHGPTPAAWSSVRRC